MPSLSNKGIYIAGGLKEIEFVLQNFQKREAHRIFKKAMKAEMTPVAKEIKAAFPKDTGKTAREIKPRLSQKKGMIYCDVSSKDDNYIPKFIEFGTVEHHGNKKIKGRGYKSLLGLLRKDGKWHIHPHMIFAETYKHSKDSVAQGIIQRIYRDAKEKLPIPE